jgi:hypothetical protein
MPTMKSAILVTLLLVNGLLAAPLPLEVDSVRGLNGNFVPQQQVVEPEKPIRVQRHGIDKVTGVADGGVDAVAGTIKGLFHGKVVTVVH